jgi:beta-lactamase regulating signal transducer with metallopeptidase domain
LLGSLSFNLLVNGALSFGCTCALVWLVLRVFRVGPDRWQLLLLSLPWLKACWDAAYGIPAGSFFWQRLQGIRQDLGSFQLGVGANGAGPLLQLRLGAKVGAHTYPQSAAEVLDSGLTRLWPALPTLIASAVLLVSALLVLRRLVAWALHARKGEKAGQCVLRVRRSLLPEVRVLTDGKHRGPPYATGFLHPRVVFSADHFARLSPPERHACLLHELAHVGHRDTLWSPLLALLTDVFWFFPGARWLLRRFDTVIELRADAAAVHGGASPETLAAALVSTGELFHASASPGVGLVRERLLARRVRRLLDPTAEPRARGGFQNPVLRLLLTGLMVLAVLQAVFFGNQPFR